VVSSLYGKEAVRASLLHFFFGKALNAVVSLLTLIALARWLAPDTYGVYIAFLALQASLLALSSLGIDATTERFMPELRTRHADSELLGFVMASISARLASLVVLALIAWFAAQPITALVGLEQHVDIFRLWVGVVVLSGMLAFSVVLLEAMLHQRQSQRCMSVYVVAKLLLLGLVYQYLQLDLRALVHIELIATGIAALVGCWLLIRRFSAAGLRSGWQVMVNNRQRMRRFAFFNYVAQVVFQLFSVEMMKLLVTRLLGVLQSARYGFAYSLAETVQRYLPAVLLLRLIKPVFVSRYTKTGDFAQLNEMARIILKLNLLLLAPMIAFAAVFGGDLLSLLSKGKYADAHWILVSVLGLLVLTSHQLVLSLLASTLEKNAMQLYAGIASTIAFPCALLLVPVIGPLGAVAASAVSGVVYNIFATVYLRRAGFDYRPDLRGVTVFLAAGAVLYGLALYLSGVLAGLAGLAIALLVGSLVYLAIVRMLSAFSHEERELLNSILPKRIFVF
jgi:O-antigen/teichoic acid export membrane protein